MTDDTVKKEEKTEVKVSKNVDKLVEEISKLTVLELSELVNTLQDKLGVTAAAPVAVAAQPAGAAEAAGDAQGGGGDNQTIVMTAAGGNKIAVIKALREINQNLGLKEAKDATESLPFEVMKDAKAEEAKAAIEKLKAAGATVEAK